MNALWFDWLTFQKGLYEWTLTYPLTQPWLDELGDNQMVQWFLMDDERVHISTDRLDRNAWPQQWSKAFEAEMAITALASKLSDDNVAFDDPRVDRELFEVTWLDPDEPFISNILAKYQIDTTAELARLVHTDTPTQIIDNAIQRLTKRWTPRREWLLMPTPFGVQFTETTVADEALAWALILQTSFSAFAAKYYFGFPRPEEVFEAYTYGEYETSALLSKMLDKTLDKPSIIRDPRTFTHYHEWAPTHPSRPAMHSAVASVLYFLNVFYDLDEYEKDQLLRLQSNIAFGRTFAWVHWPYDNIQGINLGIEVAKNWVIKELLEASNVKFDPAVLAEALSEEDYQVEYIF